MSKEKMKIEGFLVKASDQLIKICEELGYTAEATQSNSEGFVELRTVKSKKRITYTRHPTRPIPMN